MVSRIANPKGHDLILPAFKKVLEEFPDMELVIGGGAKTPDDEEKEIFKYIKNFIQENGLEYFSLQNQVLKSFAKKPSQGASLIYRQSHLFTDLDL